MSAWFGALIVALAAGFLGVVMTGVPVIKPVFFLRASFSEGGLNESILFGTLGYCIEWGVNMTGRQCTNTTIVYQRAINTLASNNQTPHIVNKWILYTLPIHIAAFTVAVISVLVIFPFAKERFKYAAGLTATLTFAAFIFDIVIIVMAKNKITTGSVVTSAQIGWAFWFTFAALILLVVSVAVDTRLMKKGG